MRHEMKKYAYILSKRQSHRTVSGIKELAFWLT